LNKSYLRTAIKKGPCKTKALSLLSGLVYGIKLYTSCPRV